MSLLALLVLLVSVLILGLTGVEQCPQGPAWWTTHALEKVRPGDPPGKGWRTGPARLAAARNEFEPFQLVLRAGEAPVRRLDVELTDLTREEGGARITSRHGTVYLERWVDLEKPSSQAGSTGEWPDPLVPRVDRYAGERRNAFPFDLEPGRNQPLWIEYYVPPDTPPGLYRGRVQVSLGGEPCISVPVELRVWPLRLPSTSSLPNTFGFSGIKAQKEHLGAYTNDADLRRLTRVYAEAALVHRLSLHGGTMAPPRPTFSGDRARVDWSVYEQEVAPFLEGKVFGPDDPLPGARTTAVELRTVPGLSDEQDVLLWRAWAEHFRERGWLDRLFLYVWDEPQGPDEYPDVRERARLARKADPELRVLVTEQLVPQLAELIDVWVPLVNCLGEGRSGPGSGDFCEETVPRAAYAALSSDGHEEPTVWFYQSCASHGCYRVGGEAFRGWPSYVVDTPATANRIMPWIAWSQGIQGELYYSTVQAYGDPGPWEDVNVFGGNGDGTLFYPGTPERIGGRTHVPVESLRLKLIREGLEDYEYLALLARTGEEKLARKLARRIAPGVRGWEQRPEEIYEIRERIARELAGSPLAIRRLEEAR